MTSKASDKRSHARFTSLNLLEYDLYDDNGTQVGRGMGRTLDISQEGVKLETTEPLTVGDHVSVHIGIQENMVTVVDGEVIHCQPVADARFNSGIRLLKLDRRSRMILDKYLELFELAKKRTERDPM